MNRTEAREKERLNIVAKVETRSQRIDARSIPVELLADKLIETNGNVARTADFFKLRYTDLARLCDRKPTLRNALVGERERLVDLAEEKLKEKVNSGNLRAVMFTLRTVGKNRGYYERRDTTDDSSPEMGEVKMKMDLTKLSGTQLRQLQEIMSTVKKDDTIIDVTPKSQDDETSVQRGSDHENEESKIA